MSTRAGSSVHPEGVRVDWVGRSGRRDRVWPGLPLTGPGLTPGPKTPASVRPGHWPAVRVFCGLCRFLTRTLFCGVLTCDWQECLGRSGQRYPGWHTSTGVCPEPGQSVRAKGGNVARAGRPRKLRLAFPSESVSAEAGNDAWTGRQGTLCLVFDSGIRPSA